MIPTYRHIRRFWACAMARQEFLCRNDPFESKSLTRAMMKCIAMMENTNE